MTTTPNPSESGVAVLLPCPFCGGEAALCEMPESFSGERDPSSFWASCQSCEAGHYPTYDKAKAIAAWNQRAHTEPRGPEVSREALRDVINSRVCRFIGEYSEDRESLIDAILAALTPSTKIGEGEGVETVVRQTTPIVADYGEHFLVAHVSKDGSLVGIDHPCDAVWADVMIAHVALRDRINERIAQQDGCPFKPKAAPPLGQDIGSQAGEG